MDTQSIAFCSVLFRISVGTLLFVLEQRRAQIALPVVGNNASTFSFSELFGDFDRARNGRSGRNSQRSLLLPGFSRSFKRFLVRYFQHFVINVRIEHFRHKTSADALDFVGARFSSG